MYSFPNLFYEKGLSFCGLKIVVHLGFENIFHTRNCFDWLGSCGSPNRAYDGFLESPIFLVCFPKFQLMTRCILGAIGHEVKAVPRRSEPEEQIW